MDEIAEAVRRSGKRKFLLEMATGTGKTLLCAALIRRFLVTRNAERVLFIVDRIELAKQTMEDFDVVLREYKPVIFKTARRTGELLGSSVVVATIQSLMMDRRYREEFTPFYFDFVINDEAHRSIYGDAREVVQFFQATRIGLTATPKAYLKNIDVEQLRQENPKALEARQLRDTYHYFGCEPGYPDVPLRHHRRGARTRKGRSSACRRSSTSARTSPPRRWRNPAGRSSINEQEENFKIQDLERKIFTPDRNRAHVRGVPAGKRRRDPTGAARQVHHLRREPDPRHGADEDPQRASSRASPSPSPRRIPDASSIAKEFRDGKRPERIAVSVDMLSTGYNCRDLLNVGPDAAHLLADRVHPDQGPRHAAVHVQGRQHRVREEALLPARFLRRGRILRGEVRLLAAAEVAAAPKAEKDEPTNRAARRDQLARPRARSAAATTGARQHAAEIPIWEGTDRSSARKSASSGRTARRWT